MFANCLGKGEKVTHGDAPGADAAEQWTDCWLRCDACAKLRLVHRDCLPSLTSSDFRRTTPVHRDSVDWLQWLKEGPDRHGVFSAKHAALSRSGNVGGGGVEESDILRFDDVQAPGLIDEDDADGDADTLSVGTTDVGSEEDRQIVQTELSRFRDAQGHSTHTDTIAAEKLYHQELEEEERLVNIAPRRDDHNHAEAVLKFECRMVQRQVRVRDVAGVVRTVWRSLSCSDADDACSLRMRGALCGSLRIGEEVLVLDACPWSHAPGISGWFQQIARVSRVLPSGVALL